MKKFFALLLALLMVLTLVACGNAKSDVEEMDEVEDEIEEQIEEQTENGTEETDAVDGEEIDLSNLELGVKEKGEDVILTVANDSPLGKVVCEMIYDYDGSNLAGVSYKYICPDEASAMEAEKSLKEDGGANITTLERKGNIVTCEMLDEEIADFRLISRDQLIEVLKGMADNIG